MWRFVSTECLLFSCDLLCLLFHIFHQHLQQIRIAKRHGYLAARSVTSTLSPLVSYMDQLCGWTRDIQMTRCKLDLQRWNIAQKKITFEHAATHSEAACTSSHVPNKSSLLTLIADLCWSDRSNAWSFVIRAVSYRRICSPAHWTCLGLGHKWGKTAQRGTEAKTERLKI